jgi:predicted aldo/keto reductase-like oxidoreductase
VAINDKQDSMAVHVLAHLAIKNLKRWVWSHDDVESWLLGMDRETQQQVRDKMNEVLKVVV